MLAELDHSQKKHLYWAIQQTEKAMAHLTPNRWNEVGSDSTRHAVTQAQAHLQQAYELLRYATADVIMPPLPNVPETLDEFLNSPLLAHPALSTWLYHRLVRVWTELTDDKRPDFTAQELLDSGLTIKRFRQCNGVGQQMVIELDNLFALHGVLIPLS